MAAKSTSKQPRLQKLCVATCRRACLSTAEESRRTWKPWKALRAVRCQTSRLAEVRPPFCLMHCYTTTPPHHLFESVNPEVPAQGL